MKAEIVELDTSVHQRVQKLLGFEGRLGEAELALVEQHSAECTVCRADLDWMRRLKAVQPAAGAAPDMEAALARLQPRLERTPAANAPKWMMWALAAQVLVIAGLATAMLRPHEDYRVLGAAQAGAQANLLVMFQPSTDEQQVRQILRGQEAQVAGGPTETGAWLVRVAPERLTAASTALRSDPAVRLAEPLEKTP